MTIWPTQPIWNAKDVSLANNPGTLPNMADTIANWFQLLTFKQVVKKTINFQTVETASPLEFQGVVQPFTSQQLAMKPEGQRAWKWFTIHAWPTLILKPDDVIINQAGTQFRVMEKLDFKEYGYVRYEMIEDYSGSGPLVP